MAFWIKVVWTGKSMMVTNYIHKKVAAKDKMNVKDTLDSDIFYYSFAIKR